MEISYWVEILKDLNKLSIDKPSLNKLKSLFITISHGLIFKFLNPSQQSCLKVFHDKIPLRYGDYPPIPWTVLVSPASIFIQTVTMPFLLNSSYITHFTFPTRYFSLGVRFLVIICEILTKMTHRLSEKGRSSFICSLFHKANVRTYFHSSYTEPKDKLIFLMQLEHVLRFSHLFSREHFFSIYNFKVSLKVRIRKGAPNAFCWHLGEMWVSLSLI